MALQDLQRIAHGKRGKALVALAMAGGIVLAGAGCSKDGDPTVPVACKEGPGAIRAALARAPARVELDGTPLSECLARARDAGDVQLVGGSFLTVATGLAERARSRPGGPETLRLGYLVGAARRGGSETQGIHDELIRRLDQELIGVDTRSPAYRRGHAAGHGSGRAAGG